LTGPAPSDMPARDGQWRNVHCVRRRGGRLLVRWVPSHRHRVTHFTATAPFGNCAGRCGGAFTSHLLPRDNTDVTTEEFIERLNLLRAATQPFFGR
jgi:hypothetical protein